ncbi:MBOAT, membrane-bound O-acyltransferase family-domain-containing protein [Podospora conica]|nr:MBOAT, membrane-bound O-acyltransferase family-domain-containing protein [Schizothecium conicum]
MHGLVMAMKQHSYASCNGYLAGVEGRRRGLLGRLKGLEREGEAEDEDLVQVLRWKVDALTDEMKGTATSSTRAYPQNLTAGNFYEFIGLPTLVYELEYPRTEAVDWGYAAEKVAACFGVMFVMILVSQAYIYPVVMDAVRWRAEGMPPGERLARLPQMVLGLVFPFVVEYLLAWFLIWETILNFVAEVTRFADRRFYDAWWNSVSWDQFARDWNRPVHHFLRRHVYDSSMAALEVDRHTATLITFFLSACAHELVMWCIFRKLRGYLLVLQMFQLPLVKLSRTRWLRDKAALGNVMFWFGICTGPSILCSLYLIL